MALLKEKEISKYLEENEIPYHYIWYYIDKKSNKKRPIGEYNKALKKTVEEKRINHVLYKFNIPEELNIN